MEDDNKLSWVRKHLKKGEDEMIDGIGVTKCKGYKSVTSRWQTKKLRTTFFKSLGGWKSKVLLVGLDKNQMRYQCAFLLIVRLRSSSS